MNLYENIFNHTNDSIAVYKVINDGEDFEFVDFNNSAEKIENTAREQLIGKKVTSVFPAIREIGLLDVFKEVYKTGNTIDHPIKLYQDGRISGWRKNRVSKIDDEHIIAVYTNVTPEKLNEQNLIDTKEEIELIFNKSPVALGHVTNDGKVTRINDAFVKLFGYDFEDIPDTQTWYQKAYPDEKYRKYVQETWAKDTKSALENNSEIKEHEYSITCKDGEVKKVLVSGYVLSNGIITRFQDITEIRGLQDQLEIKEQTYKEFFKANKAVMLLIDPKNNGQIIDANSTALEFYGYTYDEILSKSIQEINILSPKELKNEMSNALKEKRSQFNFKHKLKSGEIRDVAVSSGPLKYYGKDILYSIVNDVTEKVKLEREIQKNRDDLQNIINGMDDSLLVIDNHYNVLMMNQKAQSMTKQEYIKDSKYVKCHELFHHQEKPFKPNDNKCPLEVARETGKVHKVIHTHFDEYDKKKIIEVSITPLKNDQNEITSFLEISHDITKLIETQEELDFYINYDPLTKLPNKNLFIDRLKEFIKQAERTKAKASIIIIDLDHFKAINDSFGHIAGDEVINEFTTWLLKTTRKNDTVARLGGDTFGIFLHNIEDDLSAIHIIKKLKTLTEANTINILNQKIHVTYSAGIANFPQDGTTAEALYKNADAALYEAKEDGRNTYKYYTDKLTDKAFQQVLMDTSLRKAIKNEEFILHYQPQFDATENKLIGLEALIRWNHELLGIVSPDIFIPILEHSKLIIDVGEWIIKDVFKSVAQWYSQGINIGVVSINLSIVQIQENEELIDYIKAQINDTNCNPHWISFEITESVMMNNVEKTIDILNQITQMGFTISIDDFGTGYSSLAYLKKMPIHKLKIDRTFISDLPEDEDDATLTKTIISLAKNLHLDVIAEGVETQEQKNFLIQSGCSEIQGYYYAKPMPINELNKFLESQSLAVTTNHKKNSSSQKSF